MNEPARMQLRNERHRVVLDGKRTDDNARCTLVVVRELNGDLAIYPHGVAKLGVRLSAADVGALVQGIGRS